MAVGIAQSAECPMRCWAAVSSRPTVLGLVRCCHSSGRWPDGAARATLTSSTPVTDLPHNSVRDRREANRETRRRHYIFNVIAPSPAPTLPGVHRSSSRRASVSAC